MKTTAKLPMIWILNVRINKHAVHFRMNVLKSDLKAIEKPRLRQLYFTTETIHLHSIDCNSQFHQQTTLQDRQRRHSS